MSRTVAYVRVSTEKQFLENQLNEIKHLLGDINFEVVGEKESTDKELLELKKLVEELKSGDTLVVNAYDRLGRNLVKVVQMIQDLNKRKIKIVSVREGIDSTTSLGMLNAQLLAAIAEFEKATIKDRTKAALRQRRENGFLTHRPYNYGEEYRLRALALHDEGLGVRAIAAELGCSVGTAVNLLKSDERKELKRLPVEKRHAPRPKREHKAHRWDSHVKTKKQA